MAPLTSEGYQPRGSTPLYDAVGTLVERVDAHVASGGHDADQVVVVLTDGFENSSRKFSQHQVFTTVAERRERGWTFVFLGANQDAYAAGGDMGIARSNTANWVADDAGTRRRHEPDQRCRGDEAEAFASRADGNPRRLLRG